MKSSFTQYPSYSVLGGMAIGAGLMYLLDSGLGMRRRTGGAVTPISVVPRRQPVPDWVLGERARLETWRTLAHPDSIQVSAKAGRVTLWGPVLAGEPERLREKLVKIPGLRELELQLTTRDESAARVA